MLEELNKYLTELEKDQMNAILSKAMERRGEEGREGENQFLFMQCPCEKKEDDNLERLLKELCSSCRSHGVCPKCADDELPF